MNPLLCCRKWHWFIVWPCTNGSYLGFYPQCNVQSIFCPHHNIGHARNTTVDTKITNLLGLLFDLKHMVAIFNFTTMHSPKVRCGHTNMSGVPENLMVDTKITNLLLFWRKWYQFIIWPWKYGGYLGFYLECNVIKNFLAIPLCRAYQKTSW